MAKSTLKFDISMLRWFVTFQELSATIDEYGSPIETWVDVLNTRAFQLVKSKTSQSQVSAGEFDLYQVYTFIIRDRDSFTAKKDMRIICDGVTYIIHGIASLENNPNYIQIYTSCVSSV